MSSPFFGTKSLARYLIYVGLQKAEKAPRSLPGICKRQPDVSPNQVMVRVEEALANRKVQLIKYTKLPAGWRYCNAAFYSNNCIELHARPDSGRRTIR